jgi:hypothetical protein
MKFRLHQDYPAALDDLWAVFARADYPEQKYRALGSTAVRIQRFAVTATLITVDLERTVHLDLARVPLWARPFLGAEQRLRHHTRWQRLGPAQARADLVIVPVGQPLAASAIGAVAELAPDLTRLTLTFDVTCRLPGVGAGVARLFAGQVQSALRADHAFTLSYLAERLSVD